MVLTEECATAPVGGLVGIEDGLVSGGINLESPDVGSTGVADHPMKSGTTTPSLFGSLGVERNFRLFEDAQQRILVDCTIKASLWIIQLERIPITFEHSPHGAPACRRCTGRAQRGEDLRRVVA